MYKLRKIQGNQSPGRRSKETGQTSTSQRSCREEGHSSDL